MGALLRPGGCRNQLPPQSKWFKTTEMYGFTIWRPDNPNQGLGRTVLSLKPGGESSPASCQRLEICWQSLALSRHSTLCFPHHLAPSLCLSSRGPLLIKSPDTLGWELPAHTMTSSNYVSNNPISKSGQILSSGSEPYNMSLFFFWMGLRVGRGHNSAPTGALYICKISP